MRLLNVILNAMGCGVSLCVIPLNPPLGLLMLGVNAGLLIFNLQRLDL